MKKSQLRTIIKEEISKTLSKDINEATKFKEDLAKMIARGLVEYQHPQYGRLIDILNNSVEKVSDVEVILLDILEKAGLENNYMI